MKKQDSMRLIRKTIAQEEERRATAQANGLSHVDPWIAGRINGLKTALYFLDDPKEVAEHERFVSEMRESRAVGTERAG